MYLFFTVLQMYIFYIVGSDPSHTTALKVLNENRYKKAVIDSLALDKCIVVSKTEQEFSFCFNMNVMFYECFEEISVRI